MNQLTKDNIDNFIERFEGLDGAVVKSIQYSPHSKSDDCEFELVLTAVDSSVIGTIPFSGEVTLSILFKGDIEFRIWEPGGGVNVVINYDVVGYFGDDKAYINFDPLHSKDWETQSWSIDEVRNSPFYVGGNQIFWKIAADEDTHNNKETV
jgi:hypothetical protein